MARRKGAAPVTDATVNEGRKVPSEKREPSSLADSANPPPKSWRDVLPIHPAAELFPLMSEDEQRALGEDIKRNGLQQTITLWSPTMGGAPAMLDGRNRLDALELVGIPTVANGRLRREIPRVITLADTDPWKFVVSANIHRRHLTAEQKRQADQGTAGQVGSANLEDGESLASHGHQGQG
jgi:hypothetical protein